MRIARSGILAALMAAVVLVIPAFGEQKRMGTDLQVFVGSWNIGKPEPLGGLHFVMTLNKDKTAKKSHVPAASGKWELINGEARVVWTDGWRDIIRKDGEKFRKIAFAPGDDFDSTPNNTSSAVKVVPAFRADGFESLFDGKTLVGWTAMRMDYWSVRDGAITGESTPGNPCKSNQFIVWQGGDVEDFELNLKFRVKGNGQNSGVQFRSVIRPDGLAVGYQADIYQGGGYLGGVCDELHNRNGPELLTANGTKTVIDASGKRTVTDLGARGTMRPEGEWNDYGIVAKGQHIVLSINGVKCSELIDQEEGQFDLKGILGLQLRAGEPMTVQFKDIFLKKL